MVTAMILVQYSGAAEEFGWLLPLPSIPEMEETIRRDEAIHNAQYTDRPRHTMEIEWYTYEHDIWNRRLPGPSMVNCRCSGVPSRHGHAGHC